VRLGEASISLASENGSPAKQISTEVSPETPPSPTRGCLAVLSPALGLIRPADRRLRGKAWLVSAADGDGEEGRTKVALVSEYELLTSGNKHDDGGTDKCKAKTFFPWVLGLVFVIA
jgi:hypothetical protein